VPLIQPDPTRGWVNFTEPAITVTFHVTRDRRPGPDRQLCFAHGAPRQQSGLHVEARDRRIRHAPAQRRFRNRRVIGGQRLGLELHGAGQGHLDFGGRSWSDCQLVHNPMDRHVDVLALQQARDGQDRPAGPDGGDDAAELMRATLWSLDAHWSTSGLTVRLFCVATMTCSVSSSPGESIRGEPSRTVNSACWTTTGAVAGEPATARDGRLDRALTG